MRGETGREIDWQAGKQIDRQRAKWMDGRIDRRTDG
jgi:hypothetical protein